jgi:murein DD-endopeptidase MepM/ murein hydrolase activator NlpD
MAIRKWLGPLARQATRGWAIPRLRPTSASVYEGMPFAVRPLPGPVRRGVAGRWRSLAAPFATALLMALTVVIVALTVEVRAGREQQAALRADLAATAARGAAGEAALRADLSVVTQVNQQQQAELATRAAALAARARQAEELQRALAIEREAAAGALAASQARAGLAQADGDTWRQRAGEQQAEREALAEQVRQREAELAALTEAMAALQRQAAETEALAARVRQTLGLPKPAGPAGGDAPELAAAGAMAPAEQVAALEARWAAARQDLVAADRALQARLAALRSLATAGQPARLGAAVLAIAPTGWPVAGPLSSAFGPRLSPIDEQVRFHPGVDIVVNAGTPVKATQAGVVTLAGPHDEYGLAVIIRHAGGFETLYGHNSQLQVRVGQTVERGQVIARSGNTGASTGPHLHYEVHYQGRALDPAPLLKAT